jgi:hypothetical protein
VDHTTRGQRPLPAGVGPAPSRRGRPAGLPAGRARLGWWRSGSDSASRSTLSWRHAGRASCGYARTLAVRSVPLPGGLSTAILDGSACCPLSRTQAICPRSRKTVVSSGGRHGECR